LNATSSKRREKLSLASTNRMKRRISQNFLGALRSKLVLLINSRKVTNEDNLPVDRYPDMRIILKVTLFLITKKTNPA